MENSSLAFDAIDPEANLLDVEAGIAGYAEFRSDATNRRELFLRSLEGHSTAWIVEHTLLMAREVTMQSFVEGPLREDGATEGELVLFGNPEQVIHKLVERIQGGVNALGDMAREMHPKLRPDEHEPDCEFFGPKEDH